MKKKLFSLLLLANVLCLNTWASLPDIPIMFNKSGKSSPNAYAVLGLGGFEFQALDVAKAYQYFNRVLGIPDDHNNNNVNDNIQVCYNQAMDLDADGVNDVDMGNGKSNIQNAIQTVNKKMTEDDELYIFMAGGSHGGYAVVGNAIYDTEWLSMLKDVKCKKIHVWFLVCYSGSMISKISELANYGKEVTIITNEDDTRGSRYNNQIGNQTWESILTALGGEYKIKYNSSSFKTELLECDFDGDKKVSEEEAYAYALKNNSWGEHPQFWSNTTDYRNCSGSYSNSLLNLSGSVSTDEETLSPYLINSTQTITGGLSDYTAGKRINLKKGFKVSSGGKLHTEIFSCPQEYGTNTLRGLRLENWEEDEYPSSEFNSGEELTNSHLTLSPNPTTGEFTIFFGEESEGGNSIVITDVAGKVVYSADGLGKETSINLGEKTNGIYIVKAIANGNVQTEKLILK